MDNLVFEPITVVMIGVCFAGRLLWKKHQSRLPRVLALVAFYLETMWVFLTVTLLSGLADSVTEWVSTRQAMVWLAGLRGWLGEHLALLAWIWDGVEWLLGQVGGVALAPIAWLTIAGVIFGQAVAPQAPEFGHAAIVVARQRYESLPERVRARLADVSEQVLDVFRPIGKVMVLMWRAGPVLIGGYILLYTLAVVAAQGWLQLALTRGIGPPASGVGTCIRSAIVAHSATRSSVRFRSVASCAAFAGWVDRSQASTFPAACSCLLYTSRCV